MTLKERPGHSDKSVKGQLEVKIIVKEKGNKKDTKKKGKNKSAPTAGGKIKSTVQSVPCPY